MKMMQRAEKKAAQKLRMVAWDICPKGLSVCFFKDFLKRLDKTLGF